MAKKVKDSGTSPSEYDMAREKGRQDIERLRKAKTVMFDNRSKRLTIELDNGVVFMIPAAMIQIFDNADKEDIAEVEILLDGIYLRWPRLGEDLKLQSLIEGVFGTAKWMAGLKEHFSALGKKGGSVRSLRKQKSSVKNGRKGGRPRIQNELRVSKNLSENAWKVSGNKSISAAINPATKKSFGTQKEAVDYAREIAGSHNAKIVIDRRDRSSKASSNKSKSAPKSSPTSSKNRG